MKCKYSFDDISDYLDDIMSEESKQKLMVHMQACENCRSYYTSLSLTKKYVEEKIKLGKDFRGSTIQSIDIDRYRKTKVRHYLSRLMHKLSPVVKQGIVIAAAAVCVLLVFNGSIKSIFYNTYVSGTSAPVIKTTQHFTVCDDSGDAATLAEAGTAFEKGYEKVSKDLGLQLETKINVRIWTDIEKFHAAIGKPNTQDDIIGYVDSTLHILKSQASDGESLDSLATDGIAHIMIAAVDHGNTIPWMHAGIEDFESGHFDADTVRNSLAVLSEDGNMPTISDMLELYYTYGNYRELSFSLIEFILHEYGPDKLKRLIEKPYDMEAVFDLSQDEFKEKWAAYILRTMEDIR